MRPRRGAHTLPQPDTPGDDPPALPPTAARVQGAEEEVPGRARPDRDGLTQRRNDLPASEGAARPAPASSRRLTFRFRRARLHARRLQPAVRPNGSYYHGAAGSMPFAL